MVIFIYVFMLVVVLETTCMIQEDAFDKKLQTAIFHADITGLEQLKSEYEQYNQFEKLHSLENIHFDVLRRSIRAQKYQEKKYKMKLNASVGMSALLGFVTSGVSFFSYSILQEPCSSVAQGSSSSLCVFQGFSVVSGTLLLLYGLGNSLYAASTCCSLYDSKYKRILNIIRELEQDK